MLCTTGIQTDLTLINISKDLIDKNMLEAQLVMISFTKYNRMPTIQVNLCKSASNVTFMLDTGPNIIKKNLVYKSKIINYTNF